MPYIVALNRDRDSYQVPLAIAEAGELQAFVTDYYHGRPGQRLPSLRHRRVDGIRPDQVTTSAGAFLAQLPYEVSRRLRPTDFPSHAVESALGATAARVARRHPDADLLLYSGSARQAFEGPSRGRRILFQYHPSPGFIESVLAEVDELADAAPWWPEAEVGSAAMADKHAAEVAAAEMALCASSFTRRGLIEGGMDPAAVHVAPYGAPEPAPLRPLPAQPVQQFLFVGQGVQRKGLHLLLEAWRRADLTDAHLTVVASRLDPAMEVAAQGVPRLTLRGRADGAELARLMAEADTFVLPSLVEGFGLVLGEALSHGARLIATQNTGLVDMGLPAELGTVVEAGRVRPLQEALERAHQTYDPARPYREAAVAEARRLSWAHFRDCIRTAIDQEPTS